MKLKLNNIFILIIIIIVGFVTLLWFKNNSYITGGDAPLVFFPLTILESLLTSWSDKIFLGMPTVTYTNTVFPYLTFWSFWKMLGLSLLNIEKIWQFSLTISTGFAFYYLLKSFYPKLSMQAMILAILYYMVSPFLFVLYTPPSNSLILSIIIAPLLLALVHNLFQTNNKKYVYLIALSSVLLIGLGVNIPTLITSLFPAFLYVIFQFGKFKKNIEPFKKLFVAACYAILVNSFWIGQFLLSFNSSNVAAAADLSWLVRTSSDATLINILRSLGYWSFNSNSIAFGSNYTIYSNIYNTTFYYILSAILFSIVLLSIFNRKKYYYYFVALFILAIFMAKGPNPPLGNIFIWCYEHVPYFNMFREPWTKFTNSILISGGILFALGADFIYQKINTIKKEKIYKSIINVFIFLAIGCTIVVYSLPFFNGKIIPTDRGNYPGALVQVPDYYIDMMDWINNNSDIQGIMLLPKNIFYQIHLFFGPDGYYGADPIYENTTKRLISINPGGGYLVPKMSDTVLTSIYTKISNMDKNLNLEKALSYIRTNYILLRNDLDWTQIGTVASTKSTQQVSAYIDNKLDITKVKTFGNIDKNSLQQDEWFNELLKKNSWLDGADANIVYKINNITLEDNINVKAKNTVVYNNLEEFADIISLPMVDSKSNLTFLDNKVNSISKLQSINNEYLKFIKINDFSYNSQTYSYQYDLKLDNTNDNYNLYLNIDREQDDDYTLKIDDKEYSTDNLQHGWNNISSTKLDSTTNIQYSIKNNQNVDTTNIVRNGDFSSNLNGWELIDTTEGKIGTDGINTKITDNNSVVVKTSNHDAGLRQIIENLSTNDSYLLNFDYKNITGDKPSASIEFLSDESKSVSVTAIEDLDQGNNWHNKSYIFKPDSQKILLYLYATNNNTNLTENEYKNISIIKLPKTNVKEMVLYNQQAEKNVPQIQTIKNNETLQEYTIKVTDASDPYILNMMQSYDKGWKAEIIEDNKYEPAHIVSQGYANGWIIDKKGDYTVKIYYYPQKIILFLFGLSLVTALFVLIKIVFKKYEKK